MAGISAWRANDVVSYDAAREGATMLIALLLRRVSDEPAAEPSLTDELQKLRHDVLTVNGYDRAAVSALAAHIRGRIAELTESPS